MKVIVGLGNPGKQYAKTRHNVGFLVVDEVAKRLNEKVELKKFNAHYAEFFYNNEKVLLIKPQTYMNLSGESLIQFVNYYNINPEDVLVISDDMNLDRGRLRVRLKGSSGGQKGIQNIIDHFGHNEFPRLRVGIGKNPRIETVKYVLGKLDDDVALGRATDFVVEYLDGESLSTLMNTYNQK
ncbi:aminoacyl-tRNA hydrolase [Erysipelothrix urinaevulpis]|uniref:aminoacyl-tRNA hydrolase n=1 Tax=Erysipelothrix urinaevulpis TaxID=2683717 RepID=UPI0013581984|nr:aminoacyl-tRNA hydrolase [Erysipelothrix urinaevulpis]